MSLMYVRDPSKKEILMQPFESKLADVRVTDSLNSKVDAAAKGAHQATDKLAEQAIARVDRARDTAHKAVDSTAATAVSAGGAASEMLRRADDARVELVASTNSFIRARPLATVAGALVTGYLLGRLARW
jgi:ElaB/YqjD/DUF883 family membrane-anchored ribosome-binding protein